VTTNDIVGKLCEKGADLFFPQDERIGKINLR
jgi:hypothetical protein